EVAIGGIDVPLSAPHGPAALLGIVCGEPSIAIVLNPGGTADELWNEARRALSDLIRKFDRDQSFWLIAVRGDKIRAFPEQDAAHGGADDAARAEQFRKRLLTGAIDPKRFSDSLIRAVEMRARMLLVVTAADVEPSFEADLQNLLRTNQIVLNVVWIGPDGGA